MMVEGIPASLGPDELETMVGLSHRLGRRRTHAEKRIAGDGEPNPPQPDQGANTAPRPGAPPPRRDGQRTRPESAGRWSPDRPTGNDPWVAPSVHRQEVRRLKASSPGEARRHGRKDRSICRAVGPGESPLGRSADGRGAEPFRARRPSTDRGQPSNTARPRLTSFF